MKPTIQKLLTVALLLMAAGVNAGEWLTNDTSWHYHDNFTPEQNSEISNKLAFNQVLLASHPQWLAEAADSYRAKISNGKTLEKGFSLANSNGISAYLVEFGAFLQKPWLQIWDREANAVTVCLVTNVVETDNSYEPGWNYTNRLDVRLYYDDRGKLRVPATERYVTTIVTERKSLSLVWDGKPESITREREVSRTVRTFRKADEWREVKP